ncbi:hypothetical protein P886_1279 [Alteromonadaceae bacterium 2753L.S.0a.02]|nr:hypothetical protein P886_1279 [Alteromonadaceae bacterium 2753L.S.0a.02]
MLIRRSDIMATRPCKLCLALQDDSVFADFEIDENGSLFLVRISFDGFGCCKVRNEAKIGRIDKSKSDFLFSHLDNDYANVPEASRILREYFSQNKAFIWEDALKDHELV